MKRTQSFSLRQLFFLALAIAITFTACKKGDPGPKGDTGATGEKGSKGDKGDKGDGATISYSAWKDVTFNLTAAADGYVANLTEPKVTADIVNGGEVKTYLSLSNGTSTVASPLPYVEGDLQIVPYYWLNTIHLESNYDVSTTLNSSGVKILQYRYVIIPGSQAIRSAVNWNNYKEVAAYLGWKD